MGFLSYVIAIGLIGVGLLAMARHRHQQTADSRPKEFIRFRSYGDESKPPLVIVPGLDGVTAFFSDVLPELTLNFHVVVFNLPLVAPPLSAGASEAEEYSFAFIARQLAAVMNEAGIKAEASILGESFGGMVAQRLALDFPEKVDRLVLLSSLAKPELNSAVKFKFHYVLPVLQTIGLFFPFVAQSMFAVAHLPEVVESHEPTWVKHLFVKEASWADHWSVVARCKIAYAFDTTDELEKIKVPALVMYGEDDTFTTAGTKQLLDGIKGARAKGLPGGHLCHISYPKAFAREVADFIISSS